MATKLPADVPPPIDPSLPVLGIPALADRLIPPGLLTHGALADAGLALRDERHPFTQGGSVLYDALLSLGFTTLRMQPPYCAISSRTWGWWYHVLRQVDADLDRPHSPEATASRVARWCLLAQLEHLGVLPVPPPSNRLPPDPCLLLEFTHLVWDSLRHVSNQFGMKHKTESRCTRPPGMEDFDWIHDIPYRQENLIGSDLLDLDTRRVYTVDEFLRLPTRPHTTQETPCL